MSYWIPEDQETLAYQVKTWGHINRVQSLMMQVIQGLQKRAIQHDKSKLSRDEAPIFARGFAAMSKTQYDSEEYNALMKGIRPALEHHYAENSHHPEHYPDGVVGMDLLDLVEMLADWKAASENHEKPDFERSFWKSIERFGIDPQLASVLRNTADRLGWFIK